MIEPELSDELIREAMLRAEKAVCPPAEQRCLRPAWIGSGADPAQAASAEASATFTLGIEGALRPPGQPRA
jgi:hypothetical protein